MSKTSIPVSPPKQQKPTGIHAPVTLSFLHYQKNNPYCLSECEKTEIVDVIDTFRKLSERSWQQVMATGGKQKVGLGYTRYPRNALKGVTVPTSISPDLQVCGLRLSRKGRLFGVHLDMVFYVLWVDPNHEICKA